jgi:glycosyltransferase involved in cell wall biosynthesis
MSPPLYIDATVLFTPRPTGIARYAVRVIETLARTTPLRLLAPLSWIEVSLATRGWVRLYGGRETELTPANVPSDELDVKAWRNRVVRLPSRPIDRDALAGASVVYFWSKEQAVPCRRAVGIVYDLTPIILPRTVPLSVRQALASYYREQLPEFDHVLAISEATRADLAWLVDLDPGRIAVAYPGPNQCLRRHAFPGLCTRDPRRLLVVGVHHPRKNTQFLVDWFFASRALPRGAELLWVGPRSPALRAMRRAAANPYERRFRILGDVSDAILCRLYQEAACSVYPSLYEGFGFPVLDSLLHGTPVLCSYNSSLVEFAGPGVYYFDPCDPVSLDEAWRQYQASCPLLLEREDLRQACTWDNVARTLLRLCA